VTENDLEIFRLKFRMRLFERLVLKLCLSMLMIHDQKSIQESRQELERYLRSAGSTATATFGVLEDPALMALYCGEIEEIVDSLVRLLSKLPN
jgi:hypothetical protein